MNAKRQSKEKLEHSLYTYLCYDQKTTTKFENPFDKKHWDVVKQDAKKMAELALK